MAKAGTEPKPVSEEAAAATTLEYSGDWTEGEDLWNQALEILKNEKNSLWWPVPPAVMLQGMKTAF